MKRYYFLIAFYILLFSQLVGSQTLVIDGKTYTVDTLSSFKVGPGAQYTALRLKSSSRLDVFFLKVDASNPYVSFKAVLGRDSIYTGEQPSSMAKRKTKEGAVYFAGTNGDFYSTTGYVGLPIGGTMIEREIATTPNSWKGIAFDDTNIPGIGVMGYSGNVKFGIDTWSIHHVNHLRAENQLVLYNQHNGKYTHTNAYGTEVLVQLLEGQSWGVNKTIKLKVVKTEINKGNMVIPAGYAVLSGHGTAQTALNILAVNDEIDLTLNMLLDGVASTYSTLVGGESRAPMLRNGVVEQVDIWNELHPRTGIGYSADKKTVIYCVVDGRGASAGVTTKQLAQLMQSAGAFNAFNMDGGGSSCMYVKDFGPMNATSDGVERAVANGIFAVSSAPADNVVAEIKAYNSKISLPHYGVFMPRFIAYNQYGVLINKDLQGVVLSCSPEVGEIAADGRFVASGNNGGLVTATYNNITTQFRVDLVTSAEIAFRLDSVLLDSKRDYAVQVQSIIGLNTMDVLPAALTWTVNDPAICTVENGVIKGLKNGKTFVIGSLGGFKDTISVTVEIPISGRVIVDEFNASDWTMDASAALNVNFNTENLPASWSHGAAFNFVYTSTRAPFIKLSRNFPFYALPDTMKLMVNVGSVSVSKLLMVLKANNSTQTITREYATFPKNADTQISIALNSLFNTNDLAIYPVWLNYMNFYLGTLTAGQSYTLALKDITLCYKDIEISGVSILEMSNLQIYPNPVVNGELKIRLSDNTVKNVTVELYTMLGQCIAYKQYNDNSQPEISFATGKLSKGTYFLKVTQGSKRETVKFIIK